MKVWVTFVPPSRSVVLWRAILGKIPTEEAVRKRGLSLASRCYLCNSACETVEHIFLQCNFASALWKWFETTFATQVDRSSVLSTLKVLEKPWSGQMHDVVLAAIINIYWTIWRCRNARCHQQISLVDTAQATIIVAIRMAAQKSKGHMAHSMSEFVISRRLGIHPRYQKGSNIKQVHWWPPIPGFIKCNTDGAAQGSPGPAACGGIFRTSTGAVAGCFAMYLRTKSALEAELLAVMTAVEEAYKRRWHSLWVECDSQLVIYAFNNASFVPWRIRARWKICQQLCGLMTVRVSHIFREGNKCADKLANYAIENRCSYRWWNIVPRLVMMFLGIEVPCQNIDFVISVFFVNSMGFGIVPP